MALNREAIWAALFERLDGACPSFKRRGRRRKAQWDLEEYPVLLCLDDEGEETPTTDPRAPAPAWTLTGQIVILCRPKDTDASPTSLLNDLVFEVETAMERAAGEAIGGNAYGGGMAQNYTNLGGLVDVLRITKVDKGAAGPDLSGVAVARMTLEIEAL